MPEVHVPAAVVPAANVPAADVPAVDLPAVDLPAAVAAAPVAAVVPTAAVAMQAAITPAMTAAADPIVEAAAWLTAFRFSDDSFDGCGRHRTKNKNDLYSYSVSGIRFALQNVVTLNIISSTFL